MDMLTLPVAGLFALVLILIGFFRSAHQKTKPDSLIDIEKVSSNWLADNSWSAKLSVFVLPFLYGFNVLVWLAYGVVSVFDFLAHLFSFVWTFLRLVWYEVLHPTVFWIFKLIWHYPVGFSWRFFQLAMRHVPSSFRKDALLDSFRHLFILGLIAAGALLVYRLFPGIVTLAFGTIVVLVSLQYFVFRTLVTHKRGFGVSDVTPTLHTSLIWLLLSVIYTAILVAQTSFDIYSLSGFMVSATQIMLPIGLALFLAFATGITCLAPFFQSSRELNAIPYLRQLYHRLPKLVFAQPFQLFGFLVVGFIPFLIMFGMNYGIETFTGRGISGWWNEVSQMDSHVPNLRELNADIRQHYDEIGRLEEDLKSETTRYNERVVFVDQLMQQAIAMTESIPNDRIYTFSGDAYVGERQSFSIPHISQCTDYVFQIRKGNRSYLDQILPASPDFGSRLISHSWTEPGRYTVSVVAKNRCGSFRESQVVVDVVPMPTPSEPISKPVGNTLVCENEEAVYRTRGGYARYEWRHPYGTSNTPDEVLRLRWGTVPGTVQVRGVNNDGSTSLWSGTDVRVNLLPGNMETASVLLEDEKATPFRIERAFTFLTREHGLDSIASLSNRMDAIRAGFESTSKSLSSAISASKASIKSLKIQRMDEYHLIFGRLLAAIGIALFTALFLTTLFTHFVLYQYELYEFKQDGPHYIWQTIERMKASNPNQPLLGFFILAVGAVVVYVVYTIMVANGLMNPDSLTP